VLAFGACTVTNDDDGFGSATAQTSVTVASTMTNGDSGDGTTATGGSTTAGDDSTGGSTAGGDTSSGSSTSIDPTLAGSSSDDGVDPTDGQPADGMWSMCTVAADCGNLPILCITNADMTDGFCSTTGCANAAADCLASPGGTAMPACAPITVNDEAEQACVLSCAGGLLCPTGMVCMNFTDLGMICI
jgi:hypothetical protein